MYKHLWEENFSYGHPQLGVTWSCVSFNIISSLNPCKWNLYIHTLYIKCVTCAAEWLSIAVTARIRLITRYTTRPSWHTSFLISCSFTPKFEISSTNPVKKKKKTK